MTDPNAHRPPVGTEGRAEDRAGELIDTESNEHVGHPADVCADAHAVTALRTHRLALSLRQVADELAALADALDEADEAVRR